MSKLLAVEDALARLDESIERLQSESLELNACLDRVTREELRAQIDLPPFDQSAMDGYAVRSDDLVRVPNSLELSGVVVAGGQDRRRELRHGTTCRIFTGGLIPTGADAVVRQEWTQRIGDSVQFDRPAPVGQDIRRQGEELRAGTSLLGPGVRLNAGHLAMLGMAGVAQLQVSRSPRICVLVSGDEIVTAGNSLRPGQVYDANGPLIRAWLARGGYRNVQVKRLLDDEKAVQDTLEHAFANFDLILSSGGVSVGDRDLIVPTAEQLGAHRIFWKVSQKPGKPVFVAKKNQCLLMGLPGNPASVLVNLAVFVRRALDRLEGLESPGPQIARGVLVKSVDRDPSRDRWVRVSIESDERGMTRILPQDMQASHMLSNLAASDALAWIKAGEGNAPAGSVVPWLRLGI